MNLVDNLINGSHLCLISEACKAVALSATASKVPPSQSLNAFVKIGAKSSIINKMLEIHQGRVLLGCIAMFTSTVFGLSRSVLELSGTGGITISDRK